MSDIKPEQPLPEQAEALLVEAERILSLRSGFIPEATSHYRTLAGMLRKVLDFHYGFEDQLPTLVSLVANVFGTLQESAPGRWHIKREIDGKNGMIAFQHHVAALAAYLRNQGQQ